MAMPRFEFATATRIVFGAGTLREVAPAAAALGRRALVVTGASPGRAAPLVGALQAAGVATILFPVSGEPTVELVSRGTEFARAERCRRPWWCNLASTAGWSLRFLPSSMAAFLISLMARSIA